MLGAALFGFLFGFVGSIPAAGPVAVLVLAHAAAGRYRAGFQVAAGAALAEAPYALLAFAGLGAVLGQHPLIEPISRAVAAALVITLGVLFAIRHPAATPGPAAEPGAGRFALGFTLCALNPTLLVTWSAAVATLFSTGLVVFRPALALPFGAAVAAGTMTWFALLLGVLRRFHGRVAPRVLDGVVRVMGVALILLGVALALPVARQVYSFGARHAFGRTSPAGATT